VEKAANSNQPWATPLNKSAITARYWIIKPCTTIEKSKRILPVAHSLPEVPLKENLGGIWSVFYADEAHTEIEKIIMSCGTICEQSPYKISNVLQLPASLRLNISNVQSDYRPVRFISWVINWYIGCNLFRAFKSYLKKPMNRRVLLQPGAYDFIIVFTILPLLQTMTLYSMKIKFEHLSASAEMLKSSSTVSKLVRYLFGVLFKIQNLQRMFKWFRFMPFTSAIVKKDHPSGHHGAFHF